MGDVTGPRLLCAAQPHGPPDRGPEGLFEDTPTQPLHLVKHETFETGVLDLTYVRAEG